MHETSPGTSTVAIRPLAERDLGEADRIYRLSFGTFLGLPDPLAFRGDAELVRSRWRTDPSAFVAADLDGRLAGSCFATNWGSLGFFGPLTVRPELWDRGIGRRLVEAVLDKFAQWGTDHVGLFTFPHSPKHIALYQKYGFWPRHLTAVMRKAVAPAGAATPVLFSQLSPAERRQAIEGCFALTDAIHPGLDLRGEIGGVLAQGIGDVVLLTEGSKIDGFAVCHCGPGSEAESGVCYVKFAACRPGPGAQAAFARLLEACEAYAAGSRATSLIAGVNTARHGAYRTMLGRGFRAEIYGIAMHRPNEPAANREDVFVIDDWR